MSNQTSVSIPIPELHDQPTAYLNPGGKSGPFAVVELGTRMWLYVHEAEHARAIAAAFTKAAQLLDEAASQPQDGGQS